MSLGAWGDDIDGLVDSRSVVEERSKQWVLLGVERSTEDAE